MCTTDEQLIEKVTEASKSENERLEKRKRFAAAKIPRVQELQTECQADPTPVQSLTKPRESQTAVAVKAVRGKEAKSESTDTQPMIDELRKELQQMFSVSDGEKSSCKWTKAERERL